MSGCLRSASDAFGQDDTTRPKTTEGVNFFTRESCRLGRLALISDFLVCLKKGGGRVGSTLIGAARSRSNQPVVVGCLG